MSPAAAAPSALTGAGHQNAPTAAASPAELRFSAPELVVKSVLDRVAAGLGLLVLLPMFVLVAVLVRFTTPGPAFFRQVRVGRGGVPFTMLKFRTMRCHAEGELAELLEHNDSAGGVLFKMRHDPRVTPVGRWLRRLSIDELPQLINVLSGSMSLVGPRPSLPSEVRRYGAAARRRLLAKPGLTGLWQVSGRSDLSWDDSLRLDLDYVDNWSLALDIKVLARTVGAVMRSEGAY